MLVFPICFGGPRSGPQTEGQYGKYMKMMDYWFKMHPEDFLIVVGPLVASNFSYLHRRFPLDEGNWS